MFIGFEFTDVFFTYVCVSVAILPRCWCLWRVARVSQRKDNTPSFDPLGKTPVFEAWG